MALTTAAARWRANRAAGMCGECGLHPPVPTKARCKACKEAHKYSLDAYKLRNRDEIKERRKARYENRIKQGVCTYCGKVPPEEGKRRCKECAIKALDAVNRYKRRKENESSAAQEGV